MASFWYDLRYGARTLAKAPAFTIAAALMLSLGIAADTAVFSFINGVLLKPLPWEREGGEIVGLFSKHKTRPSEYRAFSYPNYVDIRGKLHDTAPLLFAHNFALVGVTDGDSMRRSLVSVVSANYFDALSGRPTLGRPFTADEERPDRAAPVVVLSDTLWKRMGADPAILGRTVEINKAAYTIVGVAPAEFTGSMAIASPELWLPLGVYDSVLNDFEREGAHTSIRDREFHTLMLGLRLPSGLQTSSLQTRLDRIALEMEEAFPAANREQAIITAPLSRLGLSDRPISDESLRAPMALFLGLASVVLLVACLNLANMMLSRGTMRRREIAIRLALGGGRARIVRQLVAEGLLLAALGGAVGVLLAWGALQVVVASLSAVAPIAIAFDAQPDLRVLAACTGFCVLSTILFGLAPALKTSRADVLADLKAHPTDSVPLKGFGRFSMRRLLVVGQLALSLALLTTGALFVRSAQAASGADAGFDPDRALIVGLDPGMAQLNADEGRAVYRRVLDRVRGLAGVEAASLASVVPFGEFSEDLRLRRAGAMDGKASAAFTQANRTIVTGGYFGSLGLRMLRGREFTRAEEEAPTGRRLVIVDSTAARLMFGEDDPIGRFVEIQSRRDRDQTETAEVIGVAPPIRHQLYDAGPNVYTPFGEQYRSGMTLHVRTTPESGAALVALPILRREILAVDARIPILSMRTFAMHRDKSLPVWAAHVAARVFTLFGLAALFLATAGIYSVKAYLVTRRTREIGVRMALGATVRDVLTLVMREGVGMTIAGVVVGAAVAALVGRVIARFLYRVEAFDPAAFLAAAAVLAGAALVASYLPARRAARVNPVHALRIE